MPRSLIFDSSGVPTEIKSNSFEHLKENPNFIWTNLRPGDDLKLILPEEVDRSRAFTEDLLEDQRPRIQTYQTLENNDQTYSVLIFSFPSNYIFNDDDFQLQVSFVVLENRLYSASSRENNVFPQIMSRAIALKQQFSPSSFFIFIISELIEMSIDVLEQIEEYIDYNERKMLTGGLKRGWLASLLNLKGRLYDATKMVKADIEHIRELVAGKVPGFSSEEIGDHSLDRALYLQDLIDAQREDMTNMINLHLAIASNLMNRQFYWLTIIGSLLIIPTVISSVWGMNIDVPQIDFWQMMGLISLMTVLAGVAVKLLLPKPILN